MESPSPSPSDLVERAEKANLAQLLEKLQKGKHLSTAQIRELARLQARYCGVESVTCPVAIVEGRPVVTVPAGHGVAVSADDQLAEVYAVEDRQVREWKSDLAWPGPARGPYRLGGAISSFVRAKRERAAGPSDLALAQVEYKRLQAQILQAKLQAQGAKSVSEEQVRASMASFGRGLDNILKDADETYAGVRAFVHGRLKPLFDELVSVASGEV